MQTVKKSTYSGAVCEQEIYNISDRAGNIKEARPIMRFKTEAERASHKLGISRRNHARLVNENFSPKSLYSTLTLDDENEVHTFREARHIRDLFVRRLKYAYKKAVIFIYMGRGKNTSRIHFHMLSDGIPEEVILNQWRYGEVVRIENLRENNRYNGVNYGRDYTGLADYLFNHWTPEQGGHRWKQTRNARRPHKEKTAAIKRQYSKYRPPKAPKGYALVEIKTTTYGYLYFKYILSPLC